MIKMSYLNKRIASLGVATALALTMSSCASSKEKEEITSTETTIEKVLNDETESSKPVFDPNAPITVPIETVIMENGEIGYKMPDLYEPYLVDENKHLPMFHKTLESNDGYKIFYDCYRIYMDENWEPVVDYCGYEGSVAMYHPYWRCMPLDKEHCSPELLELIYKAEDSAKQTYDEQTKANIKK